MAIENLRWVAAVISAHPNHEVVGRTRLQKTIWLLQRSGLPTNYVYSLHFYGPYSEELKADIGLAGRYGLINETARQAMDGTEYFVLSVAPSANLADITRFKRSLDLLVSANPIVLELAATYDAFRKMGLSPEAAQANVREMKGDKCNDGREERALDLIGRLELDSKAA
jgi:uncharacterized protein YwgA